MPNKLHLTVGSLFSGIGGMDLGFERAGFRVLWQCEADLHCRKLLREKFPGIPIYKEVRNIITEPLESIDLLCGGDPCPSHSRAKSNHASKHPDLSGYFLSVVGGLRPWWVVRENVHSPTVAHFAAALELLEYGVVVVRMDASGVTGQSRSRDFIIGRYQTSRGDIVRLFSAHITDPARIDAYERKKPVASCLTTHASRRDSRDNYIWDGEFLRVPDSVERERLSGFPDQWTDGFPITVRTRMTGNTVVPSLVQWIGEGIQEYEITRRDLFNDNKETATKTQGYTESDVGAT